MTRVLFAQAFAWLLCFASGVVSAAASYVGNSLDAQGGNSTSSFVLTKPTGVAENDLLITQIGYRSSSATVTAPTGWTLIRSIVQGTLTQRVYYKYAGASEGTSYTWSFSTSVRMSAAVSAFRGVEAGIAPLDSDSAGGSGTSITAPALSFSSSDVVLLTFFGVTNGSSSFSTPTSMGEFVDWGSGAGPNGATIAAHAAALNGATSTPAKTSTAADNGSLSGISVAFRVSATTLDHIRIDHTGSAVTCAAASVTVRACADATCSTVAATDVNVTLSPSGWTSGDSFTIPANSTGVTHTLAITTPQTVTLGTSAVTPTPTTATRCFVGGTETCALTFADTGFLFSTIATQTAGTLTSGHTLQAVRKSDNAATCTGVFTGNVPIQLASQCVDPTTCAGRQVAITGNGSAIAIAANPAAAISSYTSVTLDFGANSTATFSLNYPDVGRVSLSARYALNGSGEMLGTSNQYVVKPAGFDIDNIQRSADALTNPAAVNANGAAFIRAGEPFTATVTAVTSSNVATPNYGREATPEGVALTANLVGGLGLSNNPALSNATLTGFTAGAKTTTTLSWDEVGIITLTPAVADGDYLGVGNVTGSISANIGRFTPHHFDVEVVDGCGAFTYSGQPFTAHVTARNAAGATTVNYAGSNSFAKATTLSQGGDSSRFTINTNTIAGSSYGSGSASTSTPVYTFATPPENPLTLAVRATDSDGVDSSSGVEGTTGIRSGRLRLTNAFGSGFQSLSLPLRIESYRDLDPPNGLYVWHTETSDGCTALTSSVFDVSGVATTVTDVTLNAPPAATAGTGSLTLSPPNGAGTADITAKLAGTAAWLQFDWDGDGDADNPTARAGFELNPGNSKQIFKREVIGN